MPAESTAKRRTDTTIMAQTGPTKLLNMAVVEEEQYKTSTANRGTSVAAGEGLSARKAAAFGDGPSQTA